MGKAKSLTTAVEEHDERNGPGAEADAVDISFLVVTWNSGRWIDRCLRSIDAACEGLRSEVVICDNASSDDTLAVIGDRGRVIRSSSNSGFAGGTNLAFATSRGRYAFLLNPDCELAPGSVRRLYEFLEKRSEASVAAPLLEDESGATQREFQLRRLPTLRSLAVEVFAARRLFPKWTARQRYRGLDLTVPQRIEQPAGAALLIRRKVVEETGPLDEQFAPAWFEDVDYCARLAAARREIWVVPDASVRHFGGSSLEWLSFSEFNEAWYRNMWRYSQKWLGAGRSEALRWLIIVAMALRCVAVLLGVAHRKLGRSIAMGAYANVLKQAFHRWE
jgi:N-acetylglucosaminyl-diphospho-decaprenol L-rhamnosyltransferase